MGAAKGLLILHIDGLGFQYLQEGLAEGNLPFLRNLTEHEGYIALPYRCGIPSTTPFCQAGILYGDNTEIPSFRWWDKQSGLLAAFGANSTFRHVAHKYFTGRVPLVHGGACIAACYPAGAKETFGLAYRERYADSHTGRRPALRILARWAENPLNLLDWTWRGARQLVKTTLDYWGARLAGHPAARMYVLSDMLEEIFLHQITRFAVLQAMEENHPVIYAGFYAYDETGHAFGPRADYCDRILRHIDHTIERIAKRRIREQAGSRQYELVVLSDHGQTETVPFDRRYGRHFGELVAEWLPRYGVEEHRGKHIHPKGPIDGHIVLTYSGGLGHMYFKDLCWRLSHEQIQERFGGLTAKIAHTEGIEFCLTRGVAANIVTCREGEISFSAGAGLSEKAATFLSRYDRPDIMAAQLDKLNSFERAGDLILFGRLLKDQEINFEHQVGGHGSIGREQALPFLLVRKDWGLDTERVYSASDLYPLLMGLRSRIVGD